MDEYDVARANVLDAIRVLEDQFDCWATAEGLRYALDLYESRIPYLIKKKQDENYYI